MPIVRCPSCDRALNLPESADITTARCPLCQTTFVPRQPVPPSRPASEPRPVGRAVEQPSDRSLSYAGSGPNHDLHSDDNKAIASASGWMRASGIIGLFHLFFCGCGSFAFVMPHGEGLVTVYCGAYLFQLFTSLVVYNGATVLARRTSPNWVKTAGGLAIGQAVVSMVLSLPVLYGALNDMTRARRRGGDEELLVYVGVVFYLVMVSAFVAAGVKALMVMSRPGVQREFLR